MIQPVVEQGTVWFQANREFGNLAEKHEDTPRNIERAMALLAELTPARRHVKMLTANGSDLIDLGDHAEHARYNTNSLITTDANAVLHINLADCEGIAVHGPSQKLGKEVIGLLHGSCAIIGNGSYLRALDHLTDVYEVDPADMQVRLAPSARPGSYKFHDISPEIKGSDGWDDYLYQDEAGLVHIDFHQRLLDGLEQFGIPTSNITDNPIDTIADTTYFSHYRTAKYGEPVGFNGLFFALAGPSADASLVAVTGS